MSPPFPPPHFLTLTGNLLAERTLEFDRWSPGKTQRAAKESFQVGGKGINVSRMLCRLEAPNTALCFTGGATGAECEDWLRARGIPFRAFATPAPTRAGTVVRDRQAVHPETTFLGPDTVPDATAISACAGFLDRQDDGHVLALCGSFPGWTTAAFDPLRASLDRWATRGVLTVDTYGPPLADLIQRPLALLKINRDEHGTLAAKTLEGLPAHLERVVVTDGAREIRYRDPAGKTSSLLPPPIHEVSATGSGDVLHACLLQGLFAWKLPLAAAIAFAIPYAAANAAHAGIAEFPPLALES